MIILEATSGNTGIGLAMIAALKNYRCQLVMPESMSLERRKVLAAYGAELVLSPAAGYMNGAIEKARELAAGDDNYFEANQFGNPDNVKAHYETTGAEIVDQLDQIDVFVAGIGTGGTITGAGLKIKEKFQGVKIVGVEPHQGSKIQGLRNLLDFVPPIIDLELIDERVIVEDDEAFSTCRLLASEEGLFVGISAGAAMAMAIKECEKLEKGNIIVILPDSGDKYLSTGLFG